MLFCQLLVFELAKLVKDFDMALSLLDALGYIMKSSIAPVIDVAPS